MAIRRPASRASPDRTGSISRGASPNAVARAAAASSASRLLAMSRVSTLAKTGSPGFGVSGAWPRSTAMTRSRSGAGIRAHSPPDSSAARTSPAEAGSGTHGPEPIEARSSPITSETTKTRTRAGASAAASRPPPQRENRLRMRFIARDVEAGAEEQRVQLGEMCRGDAVDRRAEQAGGSAGEQDPDFVVRRPRRQRRDRVRRRPPASRHRAPGDRRPRPRARGAGQGRPPAGPRCRRPAPGPAAPARSTAASAIGRAALPRARSQIRRWSVRSMIGESAGDGGAWRRGPDRGRVEVFEERPTGRSRHRGWGHRTGGRRLV